MAGRGFGGSGFEGICAGGGVPGALPALVDARDGGGVPTATPLTRLALLPPPLVMLLLLPPKLLLLPQVLLLLEMETTTGCGGRYLCVSRAWPAEIRPMAPSESRHASVQQSVV